jgi:hypothetical protein
VPRLIVSLTRWTSWRQLGYISIIVNVITIYGLMYKKSPMNEQPAVAEARPSGKLHEGRNPQPQMCYSFVNAWCHFVNDD